MADVKAAPAAACAPAVYAYDVKPDGSPTNVVVVGYGMAGKGFHCYLVSLAATHGLHLYGVVAAREAVQKQVKADYPHARVFGTVDDALRDAKVECVVIASPSGTHTALALQCLNAGRHVVVDKPFALSLADADAMIAAAVKNRRLLTAFQNRRLDGDFRTVQELIARGALGARVKWVEMAYQKGAPNPARAAWKAEPVSAGGGRFLDLGAHMVDQCVTLFAHLPVTSVYCRMLTDFDALPGVDSHAMLTIVFGDGTTCVLDASSTAAIEKPRFYVVGGAGTFQKYGFDPQEAAMMAGDIDKGTAEDRKFWGTLKRTAAAPALDVWWNAAEGAAAAGAGGPKAMPAVQDALNYLQTLKDAFAAEPARYNEFLAVMKEFKAQELDTEGVIRRVREVLHDRPALMGGFDMFLPAGYSVVAPRPAPAAVLKGGAEAVVPTKRGGWRGFYENIGAALTAVPNGTPVAPAVSLASVRRAIAVIDAALRSAKEGKSVDLNIPALPDVVAPAALQPPKAPAAAAGAGADAAGGAAPAPAAVAAAEAAPTN